MKVFWLSRNLRENLVDLWSHRPRYGPLGWDGWNGYLTSDAGHFVELALLGQPAMEPGELRKLWVDGSHIWWQTVTIKRQEGE